MSDNNCIEQIFTIKRADREARNKHKGKVIWFTGLSCSGKSTLANALDSYLFHNGYATYILDGDNIRRGLNNNLGFLREDRQENLRRVAEVAKLFCDAGIIVLASFITPLDADRQMIKEIIGLSDLVSIFVDCPLQVCEKRDVKGLYAKARAGEVKNYTGIGAPFEVPIESDLVINTDQLTFQESQDKLFDFVGQLNLKKDCL